MIDTFIGSYKIDRMVARGGLSHVYSATHSITGHRVAIKVGEASSASGASASASRFATEARVLRTIGHSSIASIYDVGVLPNGAPYIVMEWIEGRPLYEILNSKGRLPLRIALSIARQIASALSAAHSNGYVHRDIKPSNVMVLDETLPDSWTIKLMDFGVAGILERGSGMTMAGSLIGTIYYMSPEQLRAESIDARSDVWQLGATLFEMLVGSIPFKADKAFEAMTSILSSELTIPADANIPPLVAAFLRRCLQKDPALRPPNGEAALEEIERLEKDLAGLMLASTPFSGAEIRTTLTAPVLPAEEAPATSDHFVALVVALSVITLALVIFLLRGRLHLASSPWVGVIVGACLSVGGMFFGRAIRKLLASRRNNIVDRAQDMLTGARSRDQLSQTLAIQVDDIAARCRMVDEKFLAMTMALMVDEYGASTTFDDRQKALMNAVALLEKLMSKLTPWYVRYDKLIGLIVTLVGVLTGLVTIAQNVAKLIKGT